MKLSARHLNRGTLARQLLLRREKIDAVDAIRRLAGLQAQSPASPYLALWNRIAGFRAAELDDAFATGAVVKATLMRITLHAVAATDHPAFHAAMVQSLRGPRLGDRRFTDHGHTIVDADAALPDLLEFAKTPRTAAECETHVGGHPMWWALRTFAPLRQVPTGGPWAFTSRPVYTAAEGPSFKEGRDAAIRQLAHAYLAAFGPASAADLAQFTLLPRSVARRTLEQPDEAVVEVAGPDGPLFDLVTATLPEEDEPAPPRLLGMWDQTLLAYADRSRIIPPDLRRIVLRSNGDALPTLLVDGTVAGVWRPVETGIEATAYRPLAEDEWDGLAAEARALTAFLADREPLLYGRYGHWWDKLPEGTTRTLPAS